MAGNTIENIQHMREQIARLEQKYARVIGAVQLIAVSKGQGAEKIAQACTAGQRDFGESYLQEALEKQAALAAEDICWHFIGPIQSNKTRAVAENFSWVHSVERDRIARRLSEQRPPMLPPLNVLLQVNLSGEPGKSGVSTAEVPALAEEVAKYPGLILRGLMAIPAANLSFAEQREVFRRLAEAGDNLRERGHDQCRHLSMGMSGDYEAAIAEGATMIRIGTDIFGSRQKRTGGE